ncbi:MAG: DNA cytosine methyltransferase [Xenococcaceae cyanobacterium MO_207.B15]|nr:DNA cytosine methyltransferase [Xenococcaceae cyanobacterium MO_207.B15]
MSTHISIKDASVQLKISEQRVRTLCRQGKITAEKIGNTWIVDQESLNKYALLSGHKIVNDYPSNNLIKGQQKLVALSFFSGAMGLDLGIEKAGFNIRLASEIDKSCRQTIALNRPNTALLGDINNYEPNDILQAARLTSKDDIDLIMGGPPCQAFSTAGKRKAFHDDRGNVFLKYIDLALSLKPKYLVIENVRGLLSCPLKPKASHQRKKKFSEEELKGSALNLILNKFKKYGYSYSFNLYNAANFGTPQTRERVIIICSRNGETAPFLVPTHSENGEYGLPKWKTLHTCIQKIDRHDYLSFPEKRLKYYKIIKSGQNWRNLPEELQKEAMGKSYYLGGGKTGFLRRLAWDKPSPTLVTHPAMPATDLAHPEEDRPLSIQEYKRIQEFPDNWELAGSLIQQYKQVGNAVPISLGLAVGKLIKNLINGIEIIEFNDFKYSRYRNTSHVDWEKQFLLQLEKHKNTDK